ncbi:MAG: helix-turn-helix domain-containing protein [Nitrososphaeraceae archaeon]
MSLSEEELEALYRKESYADLKERLLLVIKVEGEGMIPARVAKELRRSRTWTSNWLARYREEGIDGLESRPKSGRPSKLPERIAIRIRKKLKERKQGWTTQQVHEMIVKEADVHFHQIYIYSLLHRWGFKQKVPRKVHVNTASDEEKEEFKKEQRWF